MNDQEAIRAEQVLDAGDPDEAASICNRLLNDNPDNHAALYVLGRCFIAAGRYGLAATLYRRVVDLLPESSAAWNNLGHCLHSVNDLDQAEDIFLKANTLDPYNYEPYNNLTALMAARRRPDEAIRYGKLALWYAPSEDRAGKQATAYENMSLSLLATRQWQEGWQAFEYGLGKKWRRERQYQSEGRWDGTPGETVVFCGEQGIGDEIMFGSILPDAIRDTNAIIECDNRLKGLFQRSFPTATIYGSRHERGELPWVNNHRIDARCAFGGLGKFYRNSDDSFPREAFLVPCPTRRAMYRAALDRMPGKKIGVAWTGGTKLTRTDHRSLTASEIAAFIAKYPEHSFVSLEYKGDDIPAGIHHWPWATRTADYDDTAALVSELDAVISVTTAVALLAGAVGTECHVLVPDEPTWHWVYQGEMPWFDLQLYRGDLRSSLTQIGEVTCGSRTARLQAAS